MVYTFSVVRHSHPLCTYAHIPYKRTFISLIDVRPFQQSSEGIILKQLEKYHIYAITYL